MTKIVIKLAFIVLITIIHVCSPVAGNPIHVEEKNMTMCQALNTDRFVKEFNGTWFSDSEFYVRYPDDSFVAYDVPNRKFRELVPSEILRKEICNKITFSPDMKKLLIQYDVETIFRHSKVAKYYIINLETNETYHIANNEKLQFCAWTPKNDRIVYVLNNNVYVRQQNGEEIQLTKSGLNGIIYIGVPDWVYEEEVLGSEGAIWFSPDGDKIAVGYFDDTDVKTFTYSIYGYDSPERIQYPTEYHIKYPKAGTPNPKVQLKVIDLNSPKLSDWKELKAPVEIVTNDNILSSVTWSDKDHVLASWQNRRQNLTSIQLCNLNAECKEVTRLKEPDGWILAGVPQCLSNGTNCLMTNWIGNWYQIWNLDLNTGKNVWKSLGNFTIQKLYGYKESTNELFYQATTEDDVTVVHVYKNRECLTCSLKDVNGVPCKHASARFSKNFSFYVVKCEGPTPDYLQMYNTKTQKPVYNWEMNEVARKQLEKYLLPDIKIIQIPTGDGSTISAKLLLPPGVDIDSRQSSKKYPLIIEVYGGPNHVLVKNTFAVGRLACYATTRNVVYALIDPRGSGNKGKKNVYILNNHLGTVEIDDEYTAAKYLAETLPFVDAKRVGIWGWSYGGYTTALTIARDYKRIFKCGVSVAPVANWLLYDSIYTERYMGLPTGEDNLMGYVDSDVTMNVDNFKTHEFLLIHGSGDDNVHVQQTMDLAKVLQTNEILFREMIYTDEAHGISNQINHVRRTIQDFWNTCLSLE